MFKTAPIKDNRYGVQEDLDYQVSEFGKPPDDPDDY
jgi:hypothetical protein